MIGIDTNVMIYAHRSDSPWHEAALRVIKSLASGNAPWLLPWPCIYEFYRVVTSPKLMKTPSEREKVVTFIKEISELPGIEIIGHGVGHLSHLVSLSHQTDAIGVFVFDLQIASILIEYGADEIITNDADYLRFSGLKVTNPFRS